MCEDVMVRLERTGWTLIFPTMAMPTYTRLCCMRIPDYTLQSKWQDCFPREALGRKLTNAERIVNKDGG